MPLARSKITAQGQVSVPAPVRRKLGVGPGSLIDWTEDGDAIIVRRAGRHTSSEIHNAVFPEGPPPRRPLRALKDGIRRHVRTRHARR